MASESKRGRLPFEPRQNKKKKPLKNTPAQTEAKSKQIKTKKSEASLSAIPDVVSKRMARRMVFYCGIPSILGMSSLLIFYWLSSQSIIELPPYVALFVSFGFLGLGVLGLSYGIFSASWDEERVGSILGFEESKINLSRTVDAWRNARKERNQD